MSKKGAIAFFIVSTLFTGCNQAAVHSPQQLATDQTLRVAINFEPRSGSTSLDPAFISWYVMTAIGHNIFDGLYRYDDQLHEVPDIADSMPAISPDGLTYTFHLRHDVRFWNGEKVTASDFIYSWARAAAAQGDWASVFQPVLGYDALAGPQQSSATLHFAGLSAPDAYTLVARLTAPAGYWMAELALPSAWVVDHTAVAAGGEEKWWTTPDGLVGTGPFRLTSWTHDAELDFAAVPDWWGGSTGALRRLEMHVVPSRDDRWSGYSKGQYDILGFGRPDLGASDTTQLASLTSDSGHRAEVHTWTFGTSTWLGFNLQSGIFSGFDRGKSLRQAFSQAVDRKKLAQVVCAGGTICIPATGGLVAKGLQGYLGDGSDPQARFDAASARATIKRLDPDGSLLRDLAYYYPAGAFNQAVAENLAVQWLGNLGIDVAIRQVDMPTFFADAVQGRFSLFRLGWEADYDSPQDWFDFLFNNDCGQPLCNIAGAAYDRGGYKALINTADQQPLSASLPSYLMAGHMLVDDSVLGTLYYQVRTAAVKPYVEGYGANALWEYSWKDLRLLQH